MKTLCNELEESVYLFPDFIPIRFDEDMGQWWIKDEMIPDLPHFYVLHEDVEEPKNWYKKKYKYTPGDGWRFNPDWDAEDMKLNRNLHRKLNKMLKVFYRKKLITKKEMKDLFNTDAETL